MNADFVTIVQSTAGYLMSGCPACESSLIEKLYPRMDVWACAACRLRFRNPQPTEADLSGFYNDSFRPENLVRHETGMEGTSGELARQYVAHLDGRLGIAGKKVLEFGAGIGITCSALRASGADVIAIEPFAWNECAKTGVATYRSLDELPECSRFDLILSLQVVEHLCSPIPILRRLRHRLRPGGWLYLATPNAAGLRARLHGARWKELARYGHVLFYTPSTLDTALKQAGFVKRLRVKDLVSYGSNPLRIAAQYLLRCAGLEGELRYLAQAESES